MSLAVIPALIMLGQTTGPVTFLKTIQGIRPIAYAPMSGSRFVASLENREIRIYDAKTRMPLKNSWAIHRRPTVSIGVSTTNMLASGDESAESSLERRFRKEKFEKFARIRGVFKQFLFCDRSGTVLVSTGKDDTLRFYQVSTGKELKVARQRRKLLRRAICSRFGIR